MLRIVVLASGRGSNLQALIDARDNGNLPVEIVAVASDKPKCAALQRARDAGISVIALRQSDYPDRASFDRELFRQVENFRPQLVVLAGFMRILDATVVGEHAGCMINIHPSLLPKYPGLHTHQRALDAGDSVHGSSVHLVTPSLDAGPVIAQVRMPVYAEEDAETLATRLRPLEHLLLCASVHLIANGRVQLTSDAWLLDGEPAIKPLLFRYADGVLMPPDD